MWLGKSDLTDEHLVRTDDGDKKCAKCTTTRRAQLVRREPQVSHRDPTDAAYPRAVPEVHEHENQDEEVNDNDGEDEESPDKPDDEDHVMEGETLPEPDTTTTSSSSRGEKRTETQENVCLKRRLVTKSPKRPITLVPLLGNPVKRRLLKKTNLRIDESVMNVDEDLLNVVNTLMKDETVQETNPDEDNEMPKLTVLDDHEEMMKGRQKELNSLKEMGAMAVVKKV